MKLSPTRFYPAPLLAKAALAIFLGQAFFLSAVEGATFNWQGGGGDNAWSTAGNWVQNAVPPSDLAGTDLVFGNTAAVFPSIQPAYSIRSLNFSIGASAYNFDGGPLTLGGGGLSHQAANAQGFSAPVILGLDQTWQLTSGAGALTFGGGVKTSDGLGNPNRALTIRTVTTAGSGNTINGVIAGDGSLIKTGEGTLTLTGANTFTGGTVLSGPVSSSLAPSAPATTPLWARARSSLPGTARSLPPAPTARSATPSP